MDESELVTLKAIYNKLCDIEKIFQIKGVVSKMLSDFSKTENKESSGKKMPTMIGEYIIADKGCNRCGGKITWDLYDKESGHGYPDHVDTDGNLIDCPEY